MLSAWPVVFRRRPLRAGDPSRLLSLWYLVCDHGPVCLLVVVEMVVAVLGGLALGRVLGVAIAKLLLR